MSEIGKEMANGAQFKCTTGLFPYYHWSNVTGNMYQFITLRQASLTVLNLGITGIYKFMFKNVGIISCQTL